MSAQVSSMTNIINSNKVQSQGLLSSPRIEEETMMKQGIITILDSNPVSLSPSSLRRTLSADMSSKKWLSQNIASSEQQLLHSTTIADSISSSSEEEKEEETKKLEAEAERERLEIWSSIQRNKKEEQEKAGPFDMWTSLISLKGNDEISKSLPATPYVHPLVKRSKSSLSEKSLEICTESLGSETGSDGLFSSKTGDTEEQQQEKVTEEEEEEEEQGEEEQEELQVPKYNHATSATKKASTPHSFPPPLHSLSHQKIGPSLHMSSHRDNGRLVLEAVSVPSLNNFSVRRQDGRLVLSFANHQDQKEEEEEEEMEEEGCYGGFEFEEGGDYEEGKEHEEEDDEGDAESVIEKEPLLSSGVTSSVEGLTLVMNKPIGLVDKNSKWSEKFNEVTNFEDVNMVEVKTIQVAQSLAPRVPRLIPSAPTATSFNFNAYEYYWRTNTKPTSKATTSVYPFDQEKHHQHKNNKVVSHERQQLLVLRGKNGDYLVHNWKSCKDSRRSLLFWEPYCIATS
ncbi:hypothetical protein RJT34_31064 [Clitoria ternatea]|uniref:FAF domain-containing protein n=1 Tax=Clitoria ternatea TaxID=43366 RepID=A0AAN9EUN1_CLITE